MSVDQVVSRQVHRGVVHWVDEIGLHHGIISMVHGVGCVDHIDLAVGICMHTKRESEREKQRKSPELQTDHRVKVLSVTEAYPYMSFLFLNIVTYSCSLHQLLFIIVYVTKGLISLTQ